MDGWGALSMLIKRQQADKRRKAEIRAIYIKKKISYINTKKVKNKFNFPELTPIELKNLKKEIKKKIIRKRITSFILSTLLFILVLTGIVYLFHKKGLI